MRMLLPPPQCWRSATARLAPVSLCPLHRTAAGAQNFSGGKGAKLRRVFLGGHKAGISSNLHSPAAPQTLPTCMEILTEGEQNNKVSFCPSSSNPEELRWAKAEPSSTAAAGGVRATQLPAGSLRCRLSRARASLRDAPGAPLRAILGKRWKAPEKTWQRRLWFWYSLLQGPAPLINMNKLL